MKVISERNSRYFMVLSAFMLIMLFLTAFGDNGLLSLYKLSKRHDEVVSYNTSLVNENQRLKETVRGFKEDKRYVEKEARKALGMVGRDEVVFQFEE